MSGGPAGRGGSPCAAGCPTAPAAAVDHDSVLDLRAAVAALPARQRATLVLRFYCEPDP